jgi:hypothetical protein
MNEEANRPVDKVSLSITSTPAVGTASWRVEFVDEGGAVINPAVISTAGKYEPATGESSLLAYLRITGLNPGAPATGVEKLKIKAVSYLLPDLAHELEIPLVPDTLPPKGATLHLSGPSGTTWAIPATITMRVTHPGSTFFFGSNGKEETGGPIFSSRPGAGAAFYRCDSVTGFPGRSGGDPINRLGGSSFIALTGDEVWICASVGAFLNGSYWEYHDRYYSGNSATSSSPTHEIGTVPGSGNFSLPTTVSPYQVTVDYE